MARPVPPIKHTPAWTIFRRFEDWCLEHQCVPSQNAFYRAVIKKEWPDMTLGKYQHHFDRLKKEGFIEVDDRTHSIRPSTLTFRLSPNARPIEWDTNSPIEYVYLLKTELGYYKIGVTNDPSNRLKQIGIQLPFKVDCVHLIPSRYARRLESVLHSKFADKRTNGEWFALSDEDVSHIKSITTYEVPRHGATG